MKKLLFIILTLFFANELFASSCSAPAGPKVVYIKNVNNCSNDFGKISEFVLIDPYRKVCVYKYSYDCAITNNQGNIYYRAGVAHDLSDIDFPFTITDDGVFTPTPNPQGNNDYRCEDTFIKDGQFYNCNPSTNESEFVENSEGYEEKEDGIFPKCKAGYSAHNIGRLTSSGTENQFFCLKESNDNPDNFVGQTPISTTSSTGSYSSNSDGSTSWTGSNGNDYNYNPKTGVLIEANFSNGSVSAHNVGNSFSPGSSYTPNGQGYSVSGGGSGTGSGGTGNNGTDTGTGENPNPSNPDTPVDKEPAANSCNDSNMTLQEKMLCEMNAGIKKLNSESTPSNSLNQLIKDLNNKSTQNNDSLDTLKNNTNVTNQNLQTTNTKLDSLNTSTKSTNDKLDNLNTTLGTLNTTLKDIEKNTKSTSTSLGGSSVSTGGGSNGSGETGENENAYDDIDLDFNYGTSNSISSGIESLFDIYSTFSSNIQNEFTNIKQQIEDTKSLIVEPSNIFVKSEVSSCPTSYTIDFSSFGIADKTIIIDLCEYTATLKPLVYLFVYMSLMISLITLCLRFLGVII